MMNTVNASFLIQADWN